MLSSALITLRRRGAWALFRAVASLGKARVERDLLGKRFVKRRIHSYDMLLDTNDKGISRSLILFGTREVDHKVILEKVLRPGMKVFDIGANIGYYALMELGLIGREGSLIAIEPSPSNVKLLNRNLELNGYTGIPVIECAVSDQSSRREFFLSKQSNLNTFHTQGTGTKDLSGESIDVRTSTVPELAETYGQPDLIRMDVEGHEVEVINGLVEAVRAGTMAPMIIFETHLTRYGADHDMEAPLRALFAEGYRVRYAASSSERGTELLKGLGYAPLESVRTDDVVRSIFENISADHAVEVICRTGGARTILLAKDGGTRRQT